MPIYEDMIKAIRHTSVYIRGILALCCGFAAAQAAPLGAGANLDEKARYEKFLEQKVEEVLLTLLGPGKAKAAVQASIDFSSKESLSSEGGRSAGEELPFKWQNLNKAADGADVQELLPGFPVSSKFNPVTVVEGGSVRREVVFPQTMIKRLTVSLVLNEDIAAAETQKVTRVVRGLLAMDMARGDEIIVTKARFAPIWYTPETLNMLVKYGIIAAIAIAGMVIVGMGFLKMAGAVNSMAGAAQPQKISMEMGGFPGEAYGEEPARTLERKPADEESRVERAGGAPPDGVVFNVGEDKLTLLVKMLAKDEPADISLIAVHLPAAFRSRFIGLLPAETASEVVANMAKVRFVDPELINRVKEELERRLSGAVGGYEKVLEVMDKVDLKARKRLLADLEKKHPDVAAQVRPRILLLEDLERLDEKDFALLAGAVTVEKWAMAAWGMTEAAKEKLKGQLTEPAWRLLEQRMMYGKPSEKKIDEAIAEVLAGVWVLINEGRIKNPNAYGPPGIGHEEKEENKPLGAQT